jgi:thymidine phosphorylase
MLELGDVADARARAARALEDGSAYAKFVEMVESQGASRSALESLAPDARVEFVRAPSGGIVRTIDAVRLGNIARGLTATNPRAGIRLLVRIGDRIDRDSVIAEVFGDGVDAASIAAAFSL